MAASTKENGPNVLTINSSAPTAATRCSKFRRLQASLTPRRGSAGRSRRRRRRRGGRSERAASAIARVEVVPVPDLVLALLPAEEHLAAVADRGEIDQAAVEVAEHHLHRLQLHEGVAHLEKGVGHHAPGLATAVGGPRVLERRARLLVV